MLSEANGSTSAIWIGVAVCLGTAAALLGRLLRLDFMTRPVQFYLAVGVGGLLVAIDAAARLDIVSGASTMLSEASASGRTWTLVLAMPLAAVAFVVAAHASAKRLIDDFAEPQVSVGASRGLRAIQALVDRHPVLRVSVLELKMLRRCAFPRYQFRGIGLLLVLLLLTVLLIPDDAYAFVTVLFVVIGFGLTYAQFAFAWNSDHFAGLFSLPISMDVHVHARWVVAMILTVAAAIAMTALAIVFTFSDPLAPLICSIFAIGCLNPALILTSVLWSKRVILNSGGMANLKAYSWNLYPVILGLWMGTQLLMTLTSLQVVMLTFFGFGMVGLVCQPTGLRGVAMTVRTNLPAMAERFRVAA